MFNNSKRMMKCRLVFSHVTCAENALRLSKEDDGVENLYTCKKKKYI